jgi:hypothetical protein
MSSSLISSRADCRILTVHERGEQRAEAGLKRQARLNASLNHAGTHMHPRMMVRRDARRQARASSLARSHIRAACSPKTAFHNSAACSPKTAFHNQTPTPEVTATAHAPAPRCRWLLDGFPRTGVQAEAMRKAGIIADHFILLNVPDETLIERYLFNVSVSACACMCMCVRECMYVARGLGRGNGLETGMRVVHLSVCVCVRGGCCHLFFYFRVLGRRTDPKTGKIYHLKFNPPPDDKAVRVCVSHHLT